MNIESLTQSEIRNMSIECDKVGGLNLSQGISNLNLNNKLVEGIDRAIKKALITILNLMEILNLKKLYLIRLLVITK